MIDSHCGLGSPVDVYVYCIQVAHHIEEADIIKKIENCAQPQQLPPVWRVKSVKDNGHHTGIQKNLTEYTRFNARKSTVCISDLYLHIVVGGSDFILYLLLPTSLFWRGSVVSL